MCCIAFTLCVLHIVFIAASNALSVTHDCPLYVSVGSNLQCSCQPVPGSAPITGGGLTLQWLSYSATSQLRIDDVLISMNDRAFTCQGQYNGIVATVVYTVQVAYGPRDSDVSISGPNPLVIDGVTPVTLTCEVTAVNPTNLVTYTWSGINCNSGNSQRTCTFVPQVINKGALIRCQARNDLVLPSGSVGTANYTLDAEYPGSSTTKSQSSVTSQTSAKELWTSEQSLTTQPVLGVSSTTKVQSSVTSSTSVIVSSTSKASGTTQLANAGESPGSNDVGAIAGGVVAAVVVGIIIGVVVGVFLQRYLRNRNYARPGPRQEESIYTDLTVYEQVGNNSSNTTTDTNTNNTNKASSLPANPQAASSDKSNDYYNTSDTAAGRSTGHTYQNESFVSDNSRGVYDGLQMSDVGLQSTYTSLAEGKAQK